MVRSTIYLEIIKEEHLLEATAENGKYLLTQLKELQEKFPKQVINPRGLGLMCSFDLPTGTQRDNLADKIIYNGAFILGSGEKAIRFRPPLNISRDELNMGMEIIRTSMKQLY
jgi:L-lysine 6-transaminase